MHRRDKIRDKILANALKEFLGFYIDGLESECWIWQGSDSGTGRGGGYGRMSLNGSTVAVHIVMYVNEFGFVPGKKQIDHLCSNRMCCNPAHLEMVTHKQNQRRRRKAQREIKSDQKKAA